MVDPRDRDDQCLKFDWFALLTEVNVRVQNCYIRCVVRFLILTILVSLAIVYETNNNQYLPDEQFKLIIITMLTSAVYAKVDFDFIRSNHLLFH